MTRVMGVVPKTRRPFTTFSDWEGGQQLSAPCSYRYDATRFCFATRRTSACRALGSGGERKGNRWMVRASTPKAIVEIRHHCRGTWLQDLYQELLTDHGQSPSGMARVKARISTTNFHRAGIVELVGAAWFSRRCRRRGLLLGAAEVGLNSSNEPWDRFTHGPGETSNALGIQYKETTSPEGRNQETLRIDGWTKVTGSATAMNLRNRGSSTVLSKHLT